MTRERVRECECPEYVEMCGHFGNRVVRVFGAAYGDQFVRPGPCEGCGDYFGVIPNYVVIGPGRLVEPQCRCNSGISLDERLHAAPRAEFNTEPEAHADFDARCELMLTGGGA